MIASCKACTGEWPLKDHRIAEVGLTIAYLYEDQFFRGWTVLVLKRHATELFELTREERSGLIEEVAGVAGALAVAFDAVKINYELLGNQLAHIHWHIIPRLAGDPAPLDPVWRVPHAAKAPTQGELKERISIIRASLGKEERS
jgi:diadenosine tetraphosphate (Ap4A) HIT family hydrolase